MSNLKIGPVDITSGTATLSNGGFTVGNSSLKVNLDGSVTMASAFFPTTGGCEINKGSGNGGTSVWILGDAGKDRGVFYCTSNTTRWGQFIDSTSETGSGAGSNFNISRYSDAGTYIDNPLSINRATGVVTFVNGLKVPTRSASDNSEYAASTAYVQNVLSNFGAGVVSFNSRSGAVTLTNGDVVSAVGGHIVNTFNGRDGAVTLTASDVTTALGYTPTNASTFGIRVQAANSAGVVLADYGVINNPTLVFLSNSYNSSSLLLSVSGSTISLRDASPEPANNSGWCVHPLSSITTNVGIKYAQDIRPGDQVLSASGQYTTVLSTWISTLGNRQWLQINGESVVTPDHPIKLLNGKWGIFDLDYYFSTYPDKQYICKTSTGMKRVSNTWVTKDNTVVLEEGQILQNGVSIESLEFFKGTSNYPVIHLVTAADSFVSDGILVSSMGSF